MTSGKALIYTLIAFAVGVLGGAIGLLAVVPNTIAASSVALVLMVAVGLIYISYRELELIEADERLEADERQRERDEVQKQILSELQAINQKTKDGTDEFYTSINQRQREDHLLKALERIADSLESSDIERLVSSDETLDVETSDEDNSPKTSDSES